MFNIVSKHKRIVQIVLALISLPFAFFGVDYYFRGSGGGADDVAVFDGGKVTQAEFAQAIRDQQEMLTRSQRNVDPALFDNPEVRFNILQQVLRERMLQKKAADLHFRVSDAQVFEQIASEPRFKEGDKFSLERYRQLLAGAGIAEARYEDAMRAQILNEKLVDPIARGGIVAQATAQEFLTLIEQTREVAVSTVDAAPFLKEANAAIDAAAVKAFYEANSGAFRTPEEVKFEYVVLTPDALLPQVSVTADEVKAQYANNAKQYTKEEQRDAAHILIAVKPDAPEADQAAAKKKAEEIYAKVKANPAQFAEIAKKESQDPGSAAQGGDLGSNPRGTMVNAFEDAVWALKQPGDIAPPVRTEFGWHVIELLGITPAQTRSFDDAKAQIEADLKRQKVTQKFAQAADQFQNLVYEQADSLSGVAKALDLKVQSSQLVTRADAQRLAFGSAKFVQALFSPESVNGKRNTDAMEVAPNTLMAGRVVEYKPAAPRPFDEVKDEIRRQLAQRAAGERAQKEGREKLAMLEAGKSDKEAGVTFGKVVTLARNQPQPDFPPDAVEQIFQADAAKLPQYVGAPTGGGFSIYRIVKVSSPPAADPAKLAGAQSRVADMQNRQIFDAYVAALKAKADVKINQANLEKK
jgi:peptidyl-prolyl cis-trans isomerase D